MVKYALFALILIARFSLSAEASQGEVLERQMWESIKGHKWNDLENRIAPYFQGALFNEVFNKEHYMTHSMALNISDFILSQFKVTEGPGVLVVTYEIAVSETIEGKLITSRANRLSVWQKNGNLWQWIAHAILIPSPST